MSVRASMCSTCPFSPKADDEHSQVRGVLIERILSEASHICHQTGANNAFHRRTGKAATLCRGARNVQLAVFAATSFIESATDEAWNERCRAFGLPEIQTAKEPMPTTKRTK